VEVDGQVTGSGSHGLVVLLGVGQGDGDKDLQWMVDKVLNLRIFNDAEGKMNLSVLDVKGDLLVVSQFTLYADCRKGRRPSFIDAGPPEQAKATYERFVVVCRERGVRVGEGLFQAHMMVTLTNDGPVTIWLDSKS
jgi:D-tyrosyl-tRNA(Tyr) deacylase